MASHSGYWLPPKPPLFFMQEWDFPKEREMQYGVGGLTRPSLKYRQYW